MLCARYMRETSLESWGSSAMLSGEEGGKMGWKMGGRRRTRGRDRGEERWLGILGWGRGVSIGRKECKKG